jgi:hypothetical protein
MIIGMNRKTILEIERKNRDELWARLVFQRAGSSLTLPLYRHHGDFYIKIESCASLMDLYDI